MSERNKVVWSEGLFLRPQHFQQQERYFERYIEHRSGFRRHSWGILDLELDRDLLKLGKLALKRAKVVFPDGTPYSMPCDDEAPRPLDVSEKVRDQNVYLAIPVRRADSVEISRDGDQDALVRYALREWEARDVTMESSERIPLEVGSVHSRLLLEGTPMEDFACVPIARIRECRPDKQVVLDDSFMPTVLDVSACPPLTAFRVELAGMLKQHADALSQILVGVKAGGVAEIADLLRLQVLNRYEALIRHLERVRPVHPEELYCHLLTLCGELSTMVEQDRRLPVFPAYLHHELKASFEPVIARLRHYLSDVGPTKVEPLHVEKMLGQSNIYRVKVRDGSLFDNASFYIAASAQMDAERLRSLFASSVTIVPTLRLKEYVEGQYKGVRLEHLPMLPPQLPYYAEYIYYRLDRSHTTWPELKGAGAFGIHVAGDYPSLDMKIWAIRQ